MRGRRTFDALIALMGVLVASGCSGTPGTQASAHSPAPSAPTTSAPSPSTTSEADGCGLVLLDSTAFALGRSWELVTASRGASDHEKYVEAFIEDIDSLTDDVDDEPTQEAKNRCDAAGLAEMAYQMSLLNVHVAIDGEAEAGQYEKVANAANAWMEAVGVGDTVEPFEATFAP